MLRPMRATVQTVLLTTIGFYMAFFYNACSDVDFNKLDQKVGDLGTVQDPQDPRVDDTPFVLINGGANFTKLETVNLTLGSRDAKEMLVSYDANCALGSWEAYSANKSWDLDEKNKETHVYAKFKDSEGKIGPCVSDGIIHDDLPPAVSYEMPRELFINATQLEVKFSVLDLLSGIKSTECAHEGGSDFQPCSKIFLLNQLVEKQHKVKVKATDLAGNVSDDNEYLFIVDLTSPQVQINSGPSALTNQNHAEFEFSGSDALSGIDHFECRQSPLNIWVKCTNPLKRSNLEEAEHSFAVRSVDRAGNVSLPAEMTWRVDRSAGTVTITKRPDDYTNKHNEVVEFEGTDEGEPLTNFECKLDMEEYKACESPFDLKDLPEGAHSISVRGQDSAGNWSAPAQASWVTDRTLPSLQLVKHPDPLTRSIVADFALLARDQGSGIDEATLECQLDIQGYKSCSMAHQYKNLEEGEHQFVARVRDRAGNSVTLKPPFKWVIDHTPPVMGPIAGPDQPYSKLPYAEFEFSAQDHISQNLKFECRLDQQADIRPCASPHLYAILLDGDHVFYVRAIDEAGNASNFSSYAWSIDTMAPEITIVKAPSGEIEIDPLIRQPANQHPELEIEFLAKDHGVGLQSVSCQFNGEEFLPCKSGSIIHLAGLDPGDYEFRVTATDKLGNSQDKFIQWKMVEKPIIYCDEVPEMQIVGECVALEDSFENRSDVTHPDFGWEALVDDRGRPAGAVSVDLFDDLFLGLASHAHQAVYFWGAMGASVHYNYLVTKPLNLEKYDELTVTFDYLLIDLEDWAWNGKNGQEHLELEICTGTQVECGLHDHSLLSQSTSWSSQFSSPTHEIEGLDGRNHTLDDWKTQAVTIPLSLVHDKSQVVFRFSVILDEGFDSKVIYEDGKKKTVPDFESPMEDGVGLDYVRAVASKKQP